MSMLSQKAARQGKQALPGRVEGGGGWGSRQPRSRGSCDLRGLPVDVIGQETVRGGHCCVQVPAGKQRSDSAFLHPAQTVNRWRVGGSLTSTQKHRRRRMEPCLCSGHHYNCLHCYRYYTTHEPLLPQSDRKMIQTVQHFTRLAEHLQLI